MFKGVLLLLLVAASAAELVVQRRILESYRFQGEGCLSRGGVPVDVKLMKSDAEAENWGSSYFSLNYYDPKTTEVGRLDKGAFAGEGNLDARTVCLEQDIKYSFSVSKNLNDFEIGAVVCGNNFVKAGQTLHFSVEDNRCISFADERTLSVDSAPEVAVRTLQSSGAAGGSGAMGGSGAHGGSGAMGGSGAAGGSGAKGGSGGGGSHATGGSGGSGAKGGSGGSGAKGGSGGSGAKGGSGGSGARGGSGGSGARGGSGGSGARGGSGGSGASGGSGGSGANGDYDVFETTEAPTETVPEVVNPGDPTMRPTGMNKIPDIPLSFQVSQGIGGAKKANGGGGAFATVVADAAAQMTGLKASNFANMQAQLNSVVQRALAAGAETDVVVTYDVVTSTNEVGARTPQAAYNAIKSKLETSVSNQKFAKALASSALSHGVTGLDGVTTTSIVVSNYDVLYPTATPTSGSMTTESHGAASGSSTDNVTVGLAVGLVLAVLFIGAFAYLNWRRSHKDFIPARKEVAMTGAGAGASRAYATHDFDAEPDVTTVSPMAAEGRTVTRDSIPMADPRVVVAPKRL